MSIYYVKSNDSITVGSTYEKQNVPRISRSVPNAMASEQIAAGWPAWLVATGTEAILGWLPRKLESFHMLDKIGYGAYSTVYKARDLEHNKIVALKRLKFDNVELMMKEINILRRLDHETVIKLEGLIITSDFGLSTLSKSKLNVPLTSCIGTLWYRAPELLIGSCFYGIEVDLWSIGCVLGELFNGNGILQAILKQKVPYNAKIEETFHDFPNHSAECRGTAAIAMDHSFFKVEPFATDSFSLPKYPPTKGLDVKWKNSKMYSTIFDEINWMDEKYDFTKDALEIAPWVTIDAGRRYKMPESANSSEGANRDRSKEDQEHNFWSFIKGKKKQNHVPSTAASKRVNGHDFKGKRQQCGLLTTASNQNDSDFKGKKSNFYARLPVESNSMDVDRVLREHDRHIQEVVERAKLEKKMRAKVQVEG
ncbi:hypothetical protein KY284_024437 [Solanum tuberosum]|nr:hypothetical protein KY284_024437 [Solanum tuberosum]